MIDIGFPFCVMEQRAMNRRRFFHHGITHICEKGSPVAKVPKTGVSQFDFKKCARHRESSNANSRRKAPLLGQGSSQLVASLTYHVTRYSSHVKSPSMPNPRAQNKNHIPCCRPPSVRPSVRLNFFFRISVASPLEALIFLQIILLASLTMGGPG